MYRGWKDDWPSGLDISLGVLGSILWSAMGFLCDLSLCVPELENGESGTVLPDGGVDILTTLKTIKGSDGMCIWGHISASHRYRAQVSNS